MAHIHVSVGRITREHVVCALCSMPIAIGKWAALYATPPRSIAHVGCHVRRRAKNKPPAVAGAER
jgi:hypothetical protein